MESQGDLVLNTTKFKPSSVPDATLRFQKKIAALLEGQQQKWYHPDVGAAKFRELSRTGKTIFPPAVLLDCAKPFTIPSREAGRNIPCRVIRPEGTPTGVFMYMHGGGWVFGSEAGNDSYLKSHVDATGVAAISIGYRLAPEHPFPAAPEDCYDAVEWLVDNAAKEFGAPLTFIAGESAGAHLSALCALHLLTHSNPIYSNLRLKGLLLHYGCYDLSKTPTALSSKSDPVLKLESLEHYLDAFLPDPTTDRRDPSVSPLYFNFSALPAGSTLPPALFLCGTADRLLDDTIFMSAKWQVAGGKALVKFFPGEPHGFSGFPPAVSPGAAGAIEEVVKFMRKNLS